MSRKSKLVTLVRHLPPAGHRDYALDLRTSGLTLGHARMYAAMMALDNGALPNKRAAQDWAAALLPGGPRLDVGGYGATILNEETK